MISLFLKTAITVCYKDKSQTLNKYSDKQSTLCEGCFLRNNTQHSEADAAFNLPKHGLD